MCNLNSTIYINIHTYNLSTLFAHGGFRSARVVGTVGGYGLAWVAASGWFYSSWVGGFARRGSCVFRFGFFLCIFNDESVFRFEYFGAWVFVGVFLDGAAVNGCFGGAVVDYSCCCWL